MADDYRLLVSIGGLTLIGFVAVAVSWFVDRCHDRVSIRDDVSDISENTRNILKARMVIKRIMKKDKVQASEGYDTAAKIARAWREKTMSSRMDPNENRKNTEVADSRDRPKIAVTDASVSIVNEAECGKSQQDQNCRSDMVPTENFNSDATIKDGLIQERKKKMTNSEEDKRQTDKSIVPIESKIIDLLSASLNKPVDNAEDYGCIDKKTDETSHSVSIITRPKSRKASGNTKILSALRSVPEDPPKDAQTAERAAARSLTAVEVAMIDTNRPN